MYNLIVRQSLYVNKEMIYGVYGSTFGCNINLQRNCPFTIDSTEKKIDHLFIGQIGGNHRLNLDR